MKTTKNRLILDYADLPDLKAALGGASPGDRCEVTFKVMVVSNDDNSLEGDIESVEYDIPKDSSGDEAKSGEAEPTTEDPVMVVVAARNKSAKSKADYDAADESKSEDASDTTEE